MGYLSIADMFRYGMCMPVKKRACRPIHEQPDQASLEDITEKARETKAREATKKRTGGSLYPICS